MENNGLVLQGWLIILFKSKKIFSFCNVGKTIFRVFKILYFNGNKFLAEINLLNVVRVNSIL
jgi:hypothetical protein